MQTEEGYPTSVCKDDTDQTLLREGLVQLLGRRTE